MQYTERPEYTYDYHWGRILILAALLLSLGGGAYVLFSSPSDTEQTIQTQEFAEVEPLDSKAPASTILPDAVTENSDEPTSPQTSIDSIANTNESSEANLAEKSQEPAETSAAKEQSTAASQTVHETKEPQQVIAATAIKIEPQANKVSHAPATIQPTEPQAATDTRTKAKLFTAAIKRAKLTAEVNRREPGETLPAQLTLEENGLSKVYFYTEVIGQVGKTHYHHWYHNGKLKAKVPITIGSNRWRCYSSKYLNHQQTGKWTVKVIDAKNRLLAQSHFNFISN